jgi:hypothetical protein
MTVFDLLFILAFLISVVTMAVVAVFAFEGDFQGRSRSCGFTVSALPRISLLPLRSDS